ncbi:MAG: 3-isopropylmalate dehydrogenase [Chloroflexi bacterium]|nr:3-isopropylmalate dehydrogenase [Chloroflexota bacterium]
MTYTAQKVNIVLLPGDGIGPEVVNAAVSVLTKVASAWQGGAGLSERLIGGCAIDRCGTALPPETLTACLQADAVLLGAVGGPKWDDPTAAVRPEQGLLGLRKALGLFANLRPVQPHPALLAASPLRAERLQGVDLLVVRELTGGLYFGEPRSRREVEGQIQAIDTMAYTESEIRRVAKAAFDLARQRRKKVTSVDKANVLECSRLWRQTVTAVGKDYPDIVLEHILVDAAAMFLVSRPASFDVLVTENMFGDILTDEASVLTGSMGNLPSASLGETQNRLGLARGLYEPIHGSAPDIAGQGIANPIGTILSAAMMLRYSLGREEDAQRIERAVWETLASGARTADLAERGQPALNTAQITQAILERLK